VSSQAARARRASHDAIQARTRFESRVAFGGPDEDEDEDAEDDFIATPTRRFSLLEITSGLPDDSRETDERLAERRLRELRGRVKAARALVATTPGLAETLQRDWQKAARFYARFGIDEGLFRNRTPASVMEDRVHTGELCAKKPIFRGSAAFDTNEIGLSRGGSALCGLKVAG